ncbi:MAG: hypothetical protein WBW69_16130 [Candidatus Korobacteraceae bacterium]
MAELNVSPSQRERFSEPQSGASERQEQRTVFGAQRPDGREEPLQLIARQEHRLKLLRFFRQEAADF